MTQVRQYAGAEGSGTQQDTTMTYDGYGRLKTKHVPEQNAGTATTYNYFADDTIQKITDARGASVTYAYNGRQQVTSKTYFAPAGITPTSNVSYGYDAAGNRTSMHDGFGSVTYNYNQLSRMSSETRTFTGVGNYTIGYGYNLASQLKSITNPTNTTINYTHDNAARVTAITGTPFGGITSYTSNIQYRAWGAVKHMNYGDSTVMDASFNSRLLVSAFSVTGKISKTYDYYSDGELRFSSDLLDHRFDRFYSYDHVSRLKQAFSGAEARAEPATTNRPYKQTFGYDAFNHLTARTNEIWWTDINSLSDTYVNNRRVHSQYDADGRYLTGVNAANTYDAAGHTVHIEVPSSHSSHATFGLDGDGQQVKTEETTWNEELQTDVTDTKHYLRSSVLGGRVLSEVGGGRTFVYFGSAIIGWQMGSFSYEGIEWEHRDPSGASVRYGGWGQELDPIGGDAGTHAQTQIPDEGAFTPYGSSYSAANPNISYSVDGMRVSANDFMNFAGITLQDQLAILESFARQDPEPIDIRIPIIFDPERPYETVYANKSLAGLLALLPQKSAMDIARKKNCATPNSIVEHFKVDFEALWGKTLATSKPGEVMGDEFGALVFYEPSTNAYPIVPLSPGRHIPIGSPTSPKIPAMPEVGSDTEKALWTFRNQKRTVEFLAFFHTHPNYPGSPTTSASPKPSEFDKFYQSDYGNPLGIIRNGDGYSFFIKGKEFGPNDAMANDCVVDLKRLRK